MLSQRRMPTSCRCKGLEARKSRAACQATLGPGEQEPSYVLQNLTTNIHPDHRRQLPAPRLHDGSQYPATQDHPARHQQHHRSHRPAGSPPHSPPPQHLGRPTLQQTLPPQLPVHYRLLGPHPVPLGRSDSRRSHHHPCPPHHPTRRLCPQITRRADPPRHHPSAHSTLEGDIETTVPTRTVR